MERSEMLMICPRCRIEGNGKFCQNCGQPLMQQNAQQYQYQNNNFQNNVQQPNYNSTPQYYNPTPVHKNHTALGIIAFILSFLGYLGAIGALLGIIDIGKDSYKNNKHGLAVASIPIGLVMLVLAVGMSSGSNSSQQSNATASKKASKAEVINTSTASTAVTKADPEPVKISYKDMKLGDIGIKDNINVGLAYVKRMSYLPTALGPEENIGEGNEVILAYFDFYNNNDKNKSVSPNDITCYADGIQVGDVETYIKIESDGICQYYNEDLADHTQMISVQDYAVPKGWNELKFFYKSECIWTVSQDDVSEEPYSFSSMYTDLKVDRDVTSEGTVIYDDKYKIEFKGASDYVHNNMVWGDTSYVVFKYLITNTGSEAINYSLAGYQMTGYQNNYYLGDSVYTLNEDIDGYKNIYDVDNIEPGMSAQIYVAFESFGEPGNLYMVYDDGYIISEYRGYAYVER